LAVVWKACTYDIVGASGTVHVVANVAVLGKLFPYRVVATTENEYVVFLVSPVNVILPDPACDTVEYTIPFALPV
jgi:hypothetical protein